MVCRLCTRFEISIHALREEGDRCSVRMMCRIEEFLSTPSARRATRSQVELHQRHFISIHALREEGDRQKPEQRQHHFAISIHALREEGDSKNRDKISIFKQIIQHSARI